MTFTERMLKIDRRIIFLVIGLCTLLPLLYPVGLPIKPSAALSGQLAAQQHGRRTGAEFPMIDWCQSVNLIRGGKARGIVGQP